ncbi:hypothetical protein AGLY_007738 [Aphis glycines]|uniref:Uncharacterized protein n=1 Tax=Aphis glycines TaxID=307491 RepID=A0A6G0TNF2_APHGL|nr:hypothetical protein AGLY_007738 [Aphis glycines]
MKRKSWMIHNSQRHISAHVFDKTPLGTHTELHIPGFNVFAKYIHHGGVTVISNLYHVLRHTSFQNQSSSRRAIYCPIFTPLILIIDYSSEKLYFERLLKMRKTPNSLAYPYTAHSQALTQSHKHTTWKISTQYIVLLSMTKWQLDLFKDSERSDECIDFIMIITSRNNAPISNYGGGFRCKSEYPWCIIEVKSFQKNREKQKKKMTEKQEFLRKSSFRPNRFFYMVVIQKLITENT